MNAPTSDAGSPQGREIWVCASPKAGSGAGRQQIPALVELARRAGFRCRVTDSIPELRARLAQSPAAASRLNQPVALADLSHPPPGASAAAGGDGTVSLVAQNTPPTIPIVPMPLGTENLLARYFGCPADATGVLQAIQAGSDVQLDAGLADNRLFLLMATAGFDAEVVRAVHLRRRGHIHRLHYAGPIWRAVRRYPFPEIRVRLLGSNESAGESEATRVVTPGEATRVVTPGEATQEGTAEETLACRWAMAFNLPQYAGRLIIEPEALGSDGRLDVITFQQGSFLSGLRYLAGVSRRTHLSDPEVTRRRARTVSFESDRRVPYQLDGDYAGRLPVRIECLPARVRLRLPSASRSPKIRP